MEIKINKMKESDAKASLDGSSKHSLLCASSSVMSVDQAIIIRLSLVTVLHNRGSRGHVMG